jgi:hypothetical protein
MPYKKARFGSITSSHKREKHDPDLDKPSLHDFDSRLESRAFSTKKLAEIRNMKHFATGSELVAESETITKRKTAPFDPVPAYVALATGTTVAG